MTGAFQVTEILLHVPADLPAAGENTEGRIEKTGGMQRSCGEAMSTECLIPQCQLYSVFYLLAERGVRGFTKSAPYRAGRVV
jgi:hypothetical protein